MEEVEKVLEFFRDSRLDYGFIGFILQKLFNDNFVIIDIEIEV